MKKIIQSGILFLLLKLPVSSQIDEISWDFEPGFNYYAPTIFNSSSLNFKIPDQLKYYWDENGSTSLRDVPGFHGTTFFFLKNKVKINEKLWLESDLYIEQLGASFDLFNKDIVNVFPLVTFNFEKNIALFSDTVKSKIKYGVLKNHQEYNKLTVYGYDIQGFDFKASYKSVRFSLTHISELSFHNLEDPIQSNCFSNPIKTK